MEDPKRQAWMYLIAGVVAVAAAIYFMATSGQANDSWGLLDYAILGMGVVAIYRGVKGFRALRNGDTGSAGGSAGPTRISRPGRRSSGDSDQGGPEAS